MSLVLALSVNFAAMGQSARPADEIPRRGLQSDCAVRLARGPRQEPSGTYQLRLKLGQQAIPQRSWQSRRYL